MSTEPHGIARDQLRAFIERVERVEEEIATLNTDKSDIYKEARAVGFDVKVLRKVVAKRKLETHVREEQDAIFDMYWDALYGAPVHVHTHTRENIEENRRSDGGLSILTKHEDIRTAPVTAEEQVPSSEQSEGNGSRDHQHVHSRQTDEAKHGGQDGEPAGADHASHLPEAANETMGGTGDDCSFGNRGVWPPQGGASSSRGNDSLSVVTAGETVTISPEEAEEEFPSAEREDSAAANAGGTDVARSALRAGLADPTSNTGEGAANTALPAKPKVSFRPNCQHPENCASGTRDHCWSCRRAMQKSEEMA